MLILTEIDFGSAVEVAEFPCFHDAPLQPSMGPRPTRERHYQA